MFEKDGFSELHGAPDTPGAETVRCGPERRVSFVGSTGSGKTQLAHKFAEATGVPVFHLDELRYAANGEILSEEEFREVVCSVIDRSEWIIDGHYRLVRDLIWRQAGKIIWIDYPMHIVLQRLFTRYLRKRNRKVVVTDESQSPAAVAPAAPKVTWRHRVRRIWRALYEKRQYELLLADPAYAGAKIVRLTHPAEADAYVAALAADALEGRAPLSDGYDISLVIVELFGFPGTGKSTLAKRLAEILKFQTRADVSRSWAKLSAVRKFFYAFLGFTGFRTVSAAAALAYEAGWSSRHMLPRLFRLVAKRHWTQMQKGTVLLDQGALQSVWSIFLSVRPGGVSERTVERLFAALFRDMQPIILYVETSSELAAQRIVSRTGGSSRFDRLSVQVVSEKLQHSEWTLTTILAAADKLGFTVIHLDGTAGRDEVAQAAINELRKHGF